MWAPGRIILEFAAALITAGGFYDVFTPRLPSNLIRICGANDAALSLPRELLRALGGSLIAIGAATAYLVATSGASPAPSTLLLVLLPILPSELINAFCMFRVGSPFYFPLAFALLAFLGVVLWWRQPLR
jgi:uncharacterized protein YjeT (DUF2065 family)